MPTTTRYHGAACKTCRRRGRKCSRELPTCRSCQDRGQTCEGYALKWAGLASRGHLAGKEAPSTSPRTKDKTNANHRPTGRQSTPVLPETVETQPVPSQNDEDGMMFGNEIPTPAWTPSAFQMLEPFVFDEELDDTADEVASLEDATTVITDLALVPSHAAMIPAPRPSMSFFEIPTELSFILNYHLCEVAAKLCVDNNALANPYRQYIYPLALQKPALLYACAAMSSVHYSTCQGNESFFVEALRLRGKALSRLQESMWSSSAALDEGNLATILMLILCDMCMGGHSNFEMYFTLAKSLIDARGPLRTRDNFVEQYISWLDVMSSASTSRKSVFSPEDTTALRGASIAWSHDVVPCAADVFDILQEAITLHKESHLTLDLSTQIEKLKNRLLMLSPRTERGIPWLHLTEAYRHASLLYISVLFELDADEDEINWLVSSIIQHAKSTPKRSGWSDQLLWPLFHAGLKIEDARRQQWLREKLQEMQSSGGFRNVSSALEALEKIWSGRFTGKYSDLFVQEGVGDMLVL